MTKKIGRIALTFGLPWTILMIAYHSIINGGLTVPLLVSTLIGGLISGLLFALVMQYAANRLLKRITVEINDDESVIKEGSANHFKGKEGVGGKLLLTNKRLIFKSHKFNIQNHQDNLELAQIETLQATKTLKFLENGLSIELANNEKHKFIVDEPQHWVDVIQNQKLASN